MTLDPSATSWQRHVTELVLVIVPGLLILWDFVAVATASKNATISEVTLHFLYEHPVVALYLGVLFGHLTFPQVTTRPHAETAMLVAALLVIGFGLDRLRLLPLVMPVIPLVLGILMGHWIWPQQVATETGESLVLQTSGTAVIQTPRVTSTLDARPKI